MKIDLAKLARQLTDTQVRELVCLLDDKKLAAVRCESHHEEARRFDEKCAAYRPHGESKRSAS